MSGNSVDVCPVGALTAKPSRFVARAWEMVQHQSIAPHDCIGSNLYLHTLRGDVVRVVPRENEAINEVWLSDRDRFSYEGLDTADRLTTPMIKRDGQWQAADWDEALKLVAEKLKAAAELRSQQAADDEGEGKSIEPASEASGTEIAALITANATLEEMYLTQKVLRGLGSGNIDFRLRQSDFSDQDSAPVMRWLGQNIELFQLLDAALLIGSNVRKEQPIANLRLRKAAVNNNAQVSFLNPRRYEFNFPVANSIAVAQQNMPAELLSIAAAVFQLSGNAAPKNLATSIAKAVIDESHKVIAQQLINAGNASVLLGNIAQMHPQFSALRATAAAIAKETSATFGYLSDGCNAAGGWLAGAVPHRGAGGKTEDIISGKNLAEINNEKLAACLLVNVEPDTDAANAGEMMATLAQADFVAAITAYNSASLKKTADVMLPAASFSETSGTYVNAEGFWQSFKGVVEPKGGARPAWKVLRVLGNLTGLTGFDYLSSEEVKNEVRALCENIELSNDVDSNIAVEINAVSSELYRASEVPMYAGDAVVRRARSLQKTIDAQSLCVHLNAAEADRLGVTSAPTVTVSQGHKKATMKLVIDDSIPDASAWIPMAVEGSDLLGAAFATVKIENVGAEAAGSEAAATDTGLGA
jgi:NADH-quinone oxidoreductase subunit G